MSNTNKVGNPVPALARIFDLAYDDAYCLVVYVAASDDTWTTDYVIKSLSPWLAKGGGASERDQPLIRDLIGRLQEDRVKPAKDRVFAGIIGNIGWFVQGVASTIGEPMTLASVH